MNLQISSVYVERTSPVKTVSSRMQCVETTTVDMEDSVKLTIGVCCEAIICRTVCVRMDMWESSVISDRICVLEMDVCMRAYVIQTLM
jgi:hypothetical protein